MLNSATAVSQNCRILIVDDNEDIHTDFHKILHADSQSKTDLRAMESELFGSAPESGQRDTYELISAYQGQEALERVEESLRNKAPYAMAFVDVRMPPGWDGIETIERLWQADPRLEIVISTAYADYNWNQISDRLGASDHFVILKKPFDAIEVRQLAAALTRKWNNARDIETSNARLHALVAERTQELQNSRDHMAITLQSIGDAVIATDARGHVTLMNPIAEKLTGWTMEAVAGKPLNDIFHIVNETSREPVKSPVDRVLREGHIVGLANHTVLISKNGNEYPIADSAAPIRNAVDGEMKGVVLVFRNVSSEREAERAVRRQRDFLQTLMDCIPAPVFYKNRNGIYQGCNRAFSAFLGLPEEKIIGKTVYDLASPEKAERYHTADEKLFNNPGVQEYEGPVEAASGETRVVSFRKATYGDSPQQPDGLIGVMLDVTERTKAEERLSRLNRCLLSFGPDSKANIDKITKLAGELFGGACALYNRLSNGRLCTVSDWNAPPDLNRDDAPEGHICYDVIQKGADTAFLATDLQHSPYEKSDPNVSKYDLSAYFGQAVRVRGESVGSLCVVYGCEYSPTDEDQKLLGILASAIGMEEERLAAEEQITKTIEIQTVLNMILKSSLGTASLDSILENALDAIFYASWLSTLPRGAIFLADPERPGVLVLKATLDLPQPLHSLCKEVPFGRCLCGRAAVEKEVIYAECVDERHETRFPEMSPHGHYIVPILNGDEVLGVIDLYLAEGHKREDREVAFLESVANTLAGVIIRKRAEEAVLRSNDALVELNAQLQENQKQLVQSEKMASIGQLAAGVAHEINNPVGFIKSNLGTLAEYVETFKKLLQEQERLLAAVTAEDVERMHTAAATLAGLRQEEDLEFVLGDVDQLLSESREGTDRVRDIVLSLKSFARLDEAQLKEADVNEGIEATLKIVWNELKYKAEVTKDLNPLPRIRCYPGQLNQVFMNLLVNAAHAIPEHGEINIETAVDGENIRIRISDTGTGIDPEVLPKLFDPFFTTKDTGKGTGLGLSISHGIIEKHGGRIEVDSTPGQGTTFYVYLPIEGVAHE